MVMPEVLRDIQQAGAIPRLLSSLVTSLKSSSM
jgi:hypothetical protein